LGADRDCISFPARMFHELLSRDHEDGLATWQPQGVGSETYLKRYIAGADTRGRQEGRSNPWPQQVIHEMFRRQFLYLQKAKISRSIYDNVHNYNPWDKEPGVRIQQAADSRQLAATILFKGYFFLPAASCPLLAENAVSPCLRIPASSRCAWCLAVTAPLRRLSSLF
jgi:hypothetical protein